MDSKFHSKIILIFIIIVAGFLRFYNLMHDAPYFFNPDERNMANGIMQLRLPGNLPDIFICLISEFINPAKPPTPYNQKSPTCNLNPYFFAYGQFPLYLAFVSDQIAKPFINKVDSLTNSSFVASAPQDKQLTTNFPSAIFWLRFYSALASTLTVLIVYAISYKLFTLHFALLTSLLTTFSAGLIQAAHFGTTESLLTFFFMASVYLSISYLSHLRNLRFIVLTSLVIGLAIGSKLTGLFFIIPPLTTLFLLFIQSIAIKRTRKKLFILSFIKVLSRNLSKVFLITFILISGSILFYILSSPYNMIATDDFRSAVFGYEKDVATGKYEAFYTRQFVNSIPIFFQAEKVFPYALGWPIFILGSIGFLIIIFHLFVSFSLTLIGKSSKLKAQSSKPKSKLKALRFKLGFALWTLHFALTGKNYTQKDNFSIRSLIITVCSFLIFLLPNAFLYAKWSRFMTPILPFFAIFGSYLLYLLSLLFKRFFLINQKSKIKNQNYREKLKILDLNLSFYIFIFALCTLSLLPGAAFMSIYTSPDSRLQASYWIYQNIPKNAYILSETANVVDIPLGLPNDINEHIYNYTVVSFDFYHMDENPPYFDQLTTHLEKADYIFIPSRRIFANYTQHADKFPLVTKYYQLLYSGALGFEKIAEISSFPQLPISQIGPIRLIAEDEQAEETFTVFDHPVIRIYRKIHPLSKDEYEGLFLSTR